jgi:hypothetical protein
MQNGPFSTLFWLFFILKFVIPFPILVIPYLAPLRAGHRVRRRVDHRGLLDRALYLDRGRRADSPWPMFSPFAILASVVIFATGFFLVRGAMRKYGLFKIAD